MIRVTVWNEFQHERTQEKVKEIYPDAQILPLDYDPDVSFANLENRLQMLIMNAKKTEE